MQKLSSQMETTSRSVLMRASQGIQHAVRCSAQNDRIEGIVAPHLACIKSKENAQNNNPVPDPTLGFHVGHYLFTNSVFAVRNLRLKLNTKFCRD